MRLIIVSLATAVALAACTEQASPSAPADDAAPTPTPAPAPAPAEPRPAPPTPGDPATPAPADECGAAELKGWIGRERSSLPPEPAGAVWRIYETGQPVTMDYNASRLNIEIDPASQKVVRLTCG